MLSVVAMRRRGDSRADSSDVLDGDRLQLGSEAISLAAAPPAGPGGPSPLLFCWSHMQPKTSEVSLVRLQLVRRASIFACNYAAVISSGRYLLGNIDGHNVWSWSNPGKEARLGERGTDGATTDSFMNTETFLIAWDTLMGSKLMWDYDFVVKVDPDAVFFPDRLRKTVAHHLDETVYFANCGKYGGRVLLYGSIEVFSASALRLYDERIGECKQLPWRGWGEDYYMQKCMDVLGVTSIGLEDKVSDERCIPAPCSDYQKVSFHDFKDPHDWYACFQQAIGQI